MSTDDTPIGGDAEQTMDEDEDYTTDDTQTRWEGLNTVLALVLILSLPVIIGIVLFTGATLSPITQAWFALYSLVVLTATVWAFGKGAASKAGDMLGPQK